MFFLRVILTYLFFISSATAWDTTNFKEEALSPYTTSARNVLFVGGGLTIAVLIFEDSIIDPTQEQFVNEKPLGSLSKIGEITGQMVPNALYVLGQTFAGAYGHKLGYTRAIGMLKASAYATGLTTTLKYTVREPRPNRDNRDSFPSGHSTAAFVFGGYIYEEHGWKWGVPALAMASLAGASRINDNEHFLHDVIAGTTIGLVYGIGISKIDNMRRDQGDKEANLIIVPIINWNTKGIALIGDF